MSPVSHEIDIKITTDHNITVNIIYL